MNIEAIKQKLGHVPWVARLVADHELWKDVADRKWTAAAQTRLAARGFSPGPIDNKPGPLTRAAAAAALACHGPITLRRADMRGSPRPICPRHWADPEDHDGHPYPPTIIVMHWSGGYGDADRLQTYLESWRRDPLVKSSTHFAVDERQAVQFEDPIAFKAWHIGPDNERAIGIDLCQYPYVDKRSKRAVTERGLWTHVVDGRRPVWALDPRIAERARYVAAAVALHAGITPTLPSGVAPLRRTVDQWDFEGVGLIAHGHLANTTKVDPVVWMESIFGR